MLMLRCCRILELLFHFQCIHNWTRWAICRVTNPKKLGLITHSDINLLVTITGWCCKWKTIRNLLDVGANEQNTFIWRLGGLLYRKQSTSIYMFRVQTLSNVMSTVLSHKMINSWYILRFYWQIILDNSRHFYHYSLYECTLLSLNWIGFCFKISRNVYCYIMDCIGAFDKLKNDVHAYTFVHYAWRVCVTNFQLKTSDSIRLMVCSRYGNRQIRIEWMALSLKMLSNFWNWSKPYRWESSELMRYTFLHNMFGDQMSISPVEGGVHIKNWTTLLPFSLPSHLLLMGY